MHTTTLTTKKKLIEWLQKKLPEDDAILYSSVVDGSLEYIKKKNLQRVPVVFFAEAFKRPGDVGHVAFGKSIVFGIMIVNPDSLSEKAKEGFDKLK